jgi:hypothetical protein
MKNQQRVVLLALVTIGVTIGVFARQPIWELIQGEPKTKPPVLILPHKAVPTPNEIAKPHLSWAEEQALVKIDEHIKSLDEFFLDAKKNTPVFAKEAMDFSSKYYLVQEYIPFTRKGKHEEYIRRLFEKHLLTSANIEQTLKRVVESYLQEVKSIEGSMLVKIKADVSGFPTEYPIADYDASRLERTFDEALQISLNSSKNEAHAAISREVVSFVVGEVLSGVATQLGVSAGILGAGTTLSVKTLGIGLVVAVIVDSFVSYVWDWWKDPQGELVTKVNTKLDEINSLIKTKLKEQMVEIANERTAVRQTAVLSILKSQ